MSSTPFPTIAKISTFIPESGAGADCHRLTNDNHWILGQISTPMSGYEEYKGKRTSFGIDVLGSLVIKIEATDGTVGVATGFGGVPGCWLIEHHFARFIIHQDPRDISKMNDQMQKASMFYGRKGFVVSAISAVDLALWDLLGKIRKEPVYKMIGGATKDFIPYYMTGASPKDAKRLGFWGGKVPLKYGPADGHEGMKKNIEILRKYREDVGPDFPLMVDCWMSLNVQYAIELAKACYDQGLNINWWEECLHPDDFDGHKKLKEALPYIKWTTGEHEYGRYGFRKLIEGRYVDILQIDVMWGGGLTEAMKISSMAAAYDIPICPHGSGPYSSHLIMTLPHSPFCEIISSHPEGKELTPCFGDVFLDEPLPTGGKLYMDDRPGFGMTLNPNLKLIPFQEYQQAPPDWAALKAKKINGH